MSEHILGVFEANMFWMLEPTNMFSVFEPTDMSTCALKAIEYNTLMNIYIYEYEYVYIHIYIIII